MFSSIYNNCSSCTYCTSFIHLGRYPATQHTEKNVQNDYQGINKWHYRTKHLQCQYSTGLWCIFSFNKRNAHANCNWSVFVLHVPSFQEFQWIHTNIIHTYVICFKINSDWNLKECYLSPYWLTIKLSD